MTGAVRIIGAGAFGLAALLSALYALVLSGALGIQPFVFGGAAFVASCEREDAACTLSAATELAASAPLGRLPLAMALAEHIEAADGGAAELAPLVFERDARSEAARVLLAEAAYRKGDLAKFLSLYLPLFDTNRAQGQLYAEVLASLSANEELFKLVEAHVREARPSWGAAYLTALAGQPDVPLTGLISLYTEFPAAQPGLLNRLAEAGQWRAAYIVFDEFIGSGAVAREEAAPPLSIPYNPGLADSLAPAPFNWRLWSQGAEYLESGGIYAFFQGRHAETFVSQAFPLPAGNYRFTARMSGQVSETGGWFRWRLACAGTSNVEIAAFDMKRLSAAPTDETFDLSVPAGACEFMILSLVGVPGTFPQPARIEALTVKLENADAPGAAP
jgi:hypothetical protein